MLVVEVVEERVLKNHFMMRYTVASLHESKHAYGIGEDGNGFLLTN